MKPNRRHRSHDDPLLQHGDWVRAFCRHLAGGDDGDDLAQDTWIVALRRRPLGLESSRAWLASIARRVASNRHRAERRRLARDRCAAPAEPATPTGDLVAQSELARLVVDEVLGLEEPMREAVLLRYVEGLEPREIAARLGVPASTVRTRLQRGLGRVRASMDRRHGGRRSAWVLLLAPRERPRSSRVAMAPAALAAAVIPVAVTLALPLAATASSPLTPPTGSASSTIGRVELAPLQGPAKRAIAASTTLEQDPGGGALRAPRVRWHVPGSVSAAPLVDGERLFAVGALVRCLSAKDGAEVWAAPPAGLSGWWAGPPSLADGRLLVAHSSGGVAAFGAEDGEILWTIDPLECRAVGAPGVVVGTQGGSLLVLGATDGAVALDVETGAVVWRARLGAAAHQTPAVAEGLVLLGTERGVFAGLEAETGRVRWRVDGLGEFGWTDPVVRGGVCYVGDRGLRVGARDAHLGRLAAGQRGALNAFDAQGGELKWSTSFGATGFSTPFVGAQDVWAGFGLLCAPFDLETGALDRGRAVQTGRNAFGTPRLLGDDLVFGSLDGHLYVHDAASRELLWSFAPEGDDLQVTDWIPADGAWYVVTTAGLFALEETPGASPPARGHRLVSEAADRTPEPEGPTVLGDVHAQGPYFEDAGQLARRWSQILVPGRDPETGDVDVGRVDPEAVRDVLDAMERGLREGPATHLRAALWAAASSRGAPGLDVLRPFLAELARTGPPELRVEALRALYAVGPPEGATRAVDLPLVHAAYEVVDHEDRSSIPHLLALFGGGAVEGRSADIVLEMLEEPVREELYQWLNGLWGARLRADLSARLVELARGDDPRMAYDVVYYALSTLEEKSPGAVELLLEAVDHDDVNWSHRAMWGLGHGVPAVLQPYVAKQLAARAPGLSTQLAEEAAAIVARYR